MRHLDHLNSITYVVRVGQCLRAIIAAKELIIIEITGSHSFALLNLHCENLK